MTGSSHHESALQLRRKLSVALGVLDEPQDWGIVNADGERLDEFADYLKTHELAPTQVFDMVELLLASANERLIDDPSADLQVVRDSLRGHPTAGAVQYDYWAALDDPRSCHSARGCARKSAPSDPGSRAAGTSPRSWPFSGSRRRPRPVPPTTTTLRAESSSPPRAPQVQLRRPPPTCAPPRSLADRAHRRRQERSDLFGALPAAKAGGQTLTGFIGFEESPPAMVPNGAEGPLPTTGPGFQFRGGIGGRAKTSASRGSASWTRRHDTDGAWST